MPPNAGRAPSRVTLHLNGETLVEQMTLLRGLAASSSLDKRQRILVVDLLRTVSTLLLAFRSNESSSETHNAS